jgi:hypothetical protein
MLETATLLLSPTLIVFAAFSDLLTMTISNRVFDRARHPLHREAWFAIVLWKVGRPNRLLDGLRLANSGLQALGCETIYALHLSRQSARARTFGAI